MKKRRKLQWLACLLVAVMMTAGMPTVSARADELAFENELDLIADEPHELGCIGGGGGLNFTNCTIQRMGSSARYVPVQILQEAINVGTPAPDTRGSSAIMYTTPMYKNGNLYNLEVLYDVDSNTIYHFKYKR